MTKLEKLRDQEAENHSNVYINNDIKIRAHVGFQCGWDKRDAIAKEREAKLVCALETIIERHEQHGDDARKHGVSLGLYSICKAALADHKRMIEGEDE